MGDLIELFKSKPVSILEDDVNWILNRVFAVDLYIRRAGQGNGPSGYKALYQLTDGTEPEIRNSVLMWNEQYADRVFHGAEAKFNILVSFLDCVAESNTIRDMEDVP